MFKEKGIQSFDQDELSKLGEEVLNAAVSDRPYSASVGEVLVLGLMALDREVPENVINAVCDRGDGEAIKLLRESIKLWNVDVHDEVIRGAIKDITTRSVADLVVDKDTIMPTASRMKRLSLQVALLRLGTEFVGRR